MQDTIETWFSQIPAAPGLLACGLRFPNFHCVNRTYADGFPPETLEATWHQLAEFITSLGQHRLAATRLRWCHGRGQLHFAMRPDGISLGLCLAAGLSGGSMDGLLDEFQGLGWVMPA